MSIKALNWAWEIPTSSAIEKLVLMCYADYSDDLGKCWPAHDTVARKCGISRRTVHRHVVKLAEAGALTIRKRAGTSHEVTLNFAYSGAPLMIEITRNPPEKLSTTHDRESQGVGQNVMGTHDRKSQGYDTAVSRGVGHSCVTRSTINHQKILARAREADEQELLALGARLEVPPLPYETLPNFRSRFIETISRRGQRAAESDPEAAP